MTKEGFWGKLAKWCRRIFCKRQKGRGIIGRWIWYLFVFIVLAGAEQYGQEKLLEWKEAHSGIPDVVSSMSMNNDYYLRIVANSSRIDDKEEFARKIIHMCQDNSFHSIRFSTDINGYPSELNMTVYLNRKKLEKGKPICEIKFSADKFSKECDIKNDADKFHLYLDGEEIEFY